jgi:hypothetical protein
MEDGLESETALGLDDFEFELRLGEGCATCLCFVVLDAIIACYTGIAMRFLRFPWCCPHRSYGEVYLAKNKHTHEEVAVKVVPVEADLDDFMKEIDILKRCSSPYVVGYIGSFLRDPDLYVSSLGLGCACGGILCGDNAGITPISCIGHRADRDGIL